MERPLTSVEAMNLISAQELADSVAKKLGSDFIPDKSILVDLANEQKRLQFEKSALTAARAGDFHLVADTLLIPLKQLNEQGFKVRELYRKDALLHSLEFAADRAEYKAVESADRFILANPSFRVVDSDDVSHRNTLYSLLCSLWQQGRLTEETNTLDFEKTLKACSNGKDDLILSYRFLLKSMVDDFKSFKMAQGQAAPLKRDHDLLPPGTDKAFLISWDEELVDASFSKRFSPKMLTWCSLYWPKLIGWLNAIFQAESDAGCSCAAFVITLTGLDIQFEEWDRKYESLSIKPFPWPWLYHELILSGYGVVASVDRFDDQVNIAESKHIDAYYEFDLQEDDLLSLTVSWVRKI